MIAATAVGQSDRSVPERALIARVVAAVAAAIGACALRVDPDLWGHLRFGLDILRDRELASADPYSFTSDVVWINHEWLSEVALGLAYSAGGVAGLLALKVAIVGAAYALIARRLRGVGSVARWWIFAVIVAAAMTITSSLRPQLWTVLALTAVLSTTDWPIRRLALLWPVIFALWANFHGGWIVGLGVVATWSAGALVDRRDARLILPLAGLGALCAAATLVTPYQLDLWRFIWNTVGYERDIVEWRPVWEVHGLVFLLWAAVAAMAVLAARRGGWTWAALLPVVFLGLSSLKVIRLIGLFALAAGLLLGARWPHRRAIAFPRALAALVWIVALLPAAFITGAQVRCLPVNGPDIVAAGSLAAAAPGRLMVPFNWGQYAIWHFHDRLKVSMDGRRETVYSQKTVDLHLALDRGQSEILPFIESNRPEYVWLYELPGAPLLDPLKAAGYRQDVRTDSSSIWVRSDLPVLPAGQTTPGCFP